MLEKIGKIYIINLDGIHTMPIRIHKKKLQEVLSSLSESILSEESCVLSFRGKGGKVILVTGNDGTYVVQDIPEESEVTVQKAERNIDELGEELVCDLEADFDQYMDEKTRQLQEELRELVE